MSTYDINASLPFDYQMFNTGKGNRRLVYDKRKPLPDAAVAVYWSLIRARRHVDRLNRAWLLERADD
jgi:hypothetical protein